MALIDLTVSFILLIVWKTASELAEQLNTTVRICGLFLKGGGGGEKTPPQPNPEKKNKKERGREGWDYN